MKIFYINRVLIFILMIFSGTVIAQDLFIHDMIGGSRNEILQKFGKPVHQDNSIPSMICLFYKTSEYSMTFVLNSEGIYQVEESINYNSRQEAANAVNKIIAGSMKKDFSVDTVSTTAFQLYKTGVSADLQIFSDQISKKFTVNIKAKRSN